MGVQNSFVYYLMIIAASILVAVSNAVLTKKYQISAGTNHYATVMLALISGFMTVVFAAIVLLFSPITLEVSPYSILIACGSTMCSVIGLFCKLKAYEAGQIAISNVFASTGGVLISCLWGLLFLGETLSFRQAAVIITIIAAILLITVKPGEKVNKHILWIYLLIFISCGMEAVFSKVHQVEERYTRVNEISFLFWVGAIRVIIFVPIYLNLKLKQYRTTHLPVAAFASAVGVTLFGSMNLVVTLVVAKVLPITITSPITTGINVGLTALLPWIIYKEKLTKREIIGVILSMGGLMLYM